MSFRVISLVCLCLLIVAADVALGQCKDGAASQRESATRYEFEQVHMGTRFRLTFYARSEDAAERAAKAAFARIAELDARLSHYKDDSELMKLCRKSGSGEWTPAGDDLWRMLTGSVELSRRTDGAFDVTVGPLVQLWRRSRRRKELPSEDVLKDAMQRVGHRLIELDRERQRVRLKRADMRLDLGAIAKGYAADEALRVLADQGIRSVLIDAGGDLVAGNAPPGKKAWRVAIAATQSGVESSGKKSKARLLLLVNAAAATSGDRFQFAEIDGKRYSHIIDPRTGLGLTTQSSVTVVAPDAVTADSLASAVSVLGPKAGLNSIEDTPNCAALIIRQSKEGTEEFRSKRWSRWVEDR